MFTAPAQSDGLYGILTRNSINRGALTLMWRPGRGQTHDKRTLLEVDWAPGPDGGHRGGNTRGARKGSRQGSGAGGPGRGRGHHARAGGASRQGPALQARGAALRDPRSAPDQFIDERLVAQEAKRRSVSAEDLLKTEVFGKAPDVPDSEVQAFITQNKGRLPKMDDKELRLKVREHLSGPEGRTICGRATWQGLRAQSKVTVLLQEPISARYDVSGDRGFSRGPKDAPVTIVEFSDFQCPFCKTANTTVKQVLDKYPGKVRLVFRDYPIASLHPQAPKAHEAARCAGDQAKFWEYHDVLFERSPKMSPQDLKQYALDLKLDAAAFDQCLDSGKHTAEREQGLPGGRGLGPDGHAELLHQWQADRRRAAARHVPEDRRR